MNANKRELEQSVDSNEAWTRTKRGLRSLFAVLDLRNFAQTLFKRFRIENKIKTLPITEIISENDFFDYDAKYNGKSREETPAKIDEELADNIKNMTCKIYELLDLKSVARIDYIVVDRTPVVIEVNTIPGFSEASIVPQMLKLEGIEIKDFWRQLVQQELSK